MITEDIKIPTGGRPIEAFTIYKEDRPEKAFLVLPGKGYTINHFLLDFLWRMAAETGFYAIKAEYRGYTYRHLDEPYDHKHAAEDAGLVLNHLLEQGFKPENIVVCGKSLGTIALAGLLTRRDISLDKAILLTPVLYYKKGQEIFPAWDEYRKRVRHSYLVFGTEDPYCDIESAQTNFPGDLINCYPGADHGLHLAGNYAGTIDINREIIEKVRRFITN